MEGAIFTPLESAINNGYLDIVRYLIDGKGADPNARQRNDRTPLYSARSAKMVSLLIDKGADPALQYTPSPETPLMWYAYCGYVDCVERLLQDERVVEKINVKRPGTRSTALHEACLTNQNIGNNQASIIQMLLLHGCDPIADATQNTVDGLE